MSFFRPHRSKPRQFNYIPRYYDPVKEERERRRRELHGTSSNDNELYTPGRYIRTQREARDAAREESSRAGFVKVRNLVFVGAALVVAILLFYPRLVSFIERANEEKQTKAQAETMAIEQAKAQRALDSLGTESDISLGQMRKFMVNESIMTMDGIETLSPELLDEIDEWNNKNSLTIYDDDVLIKDGHRVDDGSTNLSK